MSISNFMKITKAEITILIDIVAVTGFLIAPLARTHILLLIPLLVAGTLASMSASLFNNVYDIDIDTKMRRTSSRNRIINISNRGMYAAVAVVMLAVSMPVAFFFLNLITMVFILGGFLSYVFLYTIFLKRRTIWNIVIGGIAGSFPALAGWSAVTGSVSLSSIFVALLVFMWTPTHFWSLATGNMEDYKAAGVPMLPAVLGIRKGGNWILANTIILVVYSMLPLFFTSIHLGAFYIPIAVIMDALMLYFVISPITRNYSVEGFKKAFHASNFYLLALLIAIWIAFI